MMTTPRLRVSAALLVAASGLTSHTIGGTQAAARAQTLSGYTVTLEEVLTSPNGASTVVAVQTQALRPDGATVLQLGPAGETARHIRIPSGLLIETNDRDKRKSTFYVSPAMVAGYVRNPRENCRRNAERFETEEMVGSYRAAKIVPDHGASTRWYALDHSCALVRSVMEHAGGSRSETLLIALIPGSPDEALFQTPNYTEGPPSMLEAAASCDASCQQRRQRRDAEYYRLRPR